VQAVIDWIKREPVRAGQVAIIALGALNLLLTGQAVDWQSVVLAVLTVLGVGETVRQGTRPDKTLSKQEREAKVADDMGLVP
jgi:hypothetical protein